MEIKTPRSKFKPMRSLTILEHPRHLSLLKDRDKPDHLFIALTPHAAYALERNGLPFKTPEDYYRHEDFFSKYQGCTSNLIDLMIALDKKLLSVDHRFQDLGVKPFFLGMYQFKLIVDTIKIFIYVLNRIVRQEAPEEITIAARSHFSPMDGELLYLHPNDPVCLFVLAKLSKTHGFQLNTVTLPKKFEIKGYAANKNHTKKITQRIRFLRDSLRNFLNLAETKNNEHAARILSVSWKDLDVLKPALETKGYRIDNFPGDDFYFSGKEQPYQFFDELKKAIHTDEEIKALCVFESIEFYEVFKGAVDAYVSNFEKYLQRYRWTKDLLGKKNYSGVILSSLASHELESIMLADICKKKDIPCICWMHGGFGANQSFEGYDTSDLLYGDYYFTYGEAVNRAIQTYHPGRTIGEDNYNKIFAHEPLRKLKTFTAGAPYLEQKFSAYTRPRNARKTVLFIMGEMWVHNQYYMGGNNPYTYFQKWDAVKMILRKLIPFQDQYQIIVKTYPHDRGTEQLLKEFLNDNTGQSIEVIRNQVSVEELIKTSDLTILTWVSSTFFQSAFADADQFLFDNSDLTDEAKRVISQTCFFSDDQAKFCFMLEDYLKEGKFYQKKKDKFLEEYLDSKNANSRAQHAGNILQEILKTNKLNKDQMKEEVSILGGGR